jgi:hypothetical protein
LPSGKPKAKGPKGLKRPKGQELLFFCLFDLLSPFGPFAFSVHQQMMHA